MLCSPISFNCFHVNSNAETRSAQIQQTQISRPVGSTGPPLSVSVSMSPSLSLMMPLSYFPVGLFTGWMSYHQRGLDPPPKLVHFSPSLHFFLHLFTNLHCAVLFWGGFVMMCIFDFLCRVNSSLVGAM